MATSGVATVSLRACLRSTPEKTETAVMRALTKQGMPLLDGKPHPDYCYRFEDDQAFEAVTVRWRAFCAGDCIDCGRWDSALIDGAVCQTCYDKSAPTNRG